MCIIYAVFYILRQILIYILYFIDLGRHYICCILYTQARHYIGCILYTQAGITQAVFYTHRLALHRLHFIHLGRHYIWTLYMLHFICCIIYAEFYKLRQTLICCIMLQYFITQVDITYVVFYTLRQTLYMLYFIHIGWHTQVVFYTYRLALHRLYCIHISWHYICSILYTQVDITYAILYTIR